MNNKIIPITFICEEVNIKSLSIALVSLLENAGNETRYDINILTNKRYTPNNTKLIEVIKEKYNCNITFYKIHYTCTSIEEICKLISYNFNNLNKCIYLNHNVIVQRDLTELFNISSSNNSIAGVRQIDDEINSSVLLIDCEKVRSDNSKIGEIDLKYNLQAYLLKGEKSFDFDKQVEIKSDFVSKYDKKQLKSALKENVIFSYTDDVNPFITGDCSFVDVWFKYFNISPITNKTDIKTPLVSVVIPVYNVGNYLEMCVNSIINQSYKNIEIILVDDGAMENTGQMCYDFYKKDNRITVIYKPNEKISSAYNLASKVVKGDYVSFINSNDLIHPRTYETAINCIKKEEYLDYVEWKLSALQQNNIIYNNRKDIKFNKLTNIKIFVGDNYRYVKDKIVLVPTTTNVGCKLFKSDLIDKIIFKDRMFFSEKYIQKYKKMCLIDMPLCQKLTMD